VEFQALKNINVSVPKGQFASIVGASGSGKSTLLYVLTTLDTDYKGHIYFDGEDLSVLSKNRQAEIRNEKIGFVFQFHYLLPEFTVLENVSLPALKLARYSEKEIETRAYEKLKLLGMESQALKKANKLSGGQQQRVAIARALINDPKIIFGDEPTGNLDSKNAQIVFDIFKELQSKLNQTILIVTHDLSMAEKTDRIITLHDGEIVSQ
jgi:lipoprotein-releasing system ATP-binding protein